MDIMEPGYKMLGSSGTQYLNPDYIQPLPTTLDSKNSPLALLAQTCSSIGKDSGSSSSKLSLPSLGGDKKDSSTSSSSSSSAHQRENGGKDCNKQRSSESPMDRGCSGGPGSSSRTSGDGGRSNKSGDKSSKDCSSRSSSGGGGGGGGGSSSPKSRAHSSSRPLSSLVSIGNGSGKCTPSSVNTFSSGSGSLHRDYSSATRGTSTTSSSSTGGGGVALPPSSALNNNNKTMGGETGSSSSSGSLLYDSYSDDILKSSGLTSSSLLQHQQHSLQEALRLQHEGLQSLQAAAAAGLGPLPSGYPPLLFGHPLAAALDPLMYSYSASLAAVHGLALSSHKLPTLSPYMGYARVSTASGGSTLVPVCKDPYCTTGPLHSGHSLQPHGGPSSHGGASTSCGPGCTQCGSSSASAQDKSHQCTVASPSTSLSNGGGGGLGSAGQYSSSLYPLSLPPGGLGNPLLGMAAAAHLGVGLTPYACSWLSGGGEFCGKRFSKAEDLLQHLRTHASSGETAALPAFSLPPGVPLPSSAGFAGAGHPFTIPGSLSPSSMLQQAAAAAAGGQLYPRSLSPSSLLSASRYHPYKSPFAAVLPTSSAVSGALGGSAGSPLDAYYSSPYALYGHRIGAATVGP